MKGDELWSDEKFAHAKAVHVVSDDTIFVETLDVLVEIRLLSVNVEKLTASINAFSRFHERVARAAVDAGGTRPH